MAWHTFLCPKCYKEVSVPGEAIGKAGKCNLCGAAIAVPTREQDASLRERLRQRAAADAEEKRRRNEAEQMRKEEERRHAEAERIRQREEKLRLEEEERTRREVVRRQSEAAKENDKLRSNLRSSTNELPAPALPAEAPAATPGAPSAITRLLGFGGGRIVTKKIMGAVAAGALLGAAIVACVWWSVSAYKSAGYRVGAEVRAVSSSNEYSAARSLRGKDLIAWKMAYRAVQEEMRQWNDVPNTIASIPYTELYIGPDQPQKDLMERTRTGDWVFYFCIYGYYNQSSPASSPQFAKFTLLEVVRVDDLGGSLKAGIVKSGGPGSEQECEKRFGLMTKKFFDQHPPGFADAARRAWEARSRGVLPGTRP